MSVTRDFDAMLAEQAGDRPTFKVGGQVFTLRAKLPYKTWNRLLATMRNDDVDPMVATEEFFRTVLAKKDRERFIDLINVEDTDDDGEDDNVIGVDQLNELTDYCMEYFTGKLQRNTDSSKPGSNGTGPAPNVVSLQSKAAANA